MSGLGHAIEIAIKLKRKKQKKLKEAVMTFEQYLTELSVATLQSYKQKNADERAGHAQMSRFYAKMANRNRPGMGGNNQKFANKMWNSFHNETTKSAKRLKGSFAADRALARKGIKSETNI